MNGTKLPHSIDIDLQTIKLCQLINKVLISSIAPNPTGGVPGPGVISAGAAAGGSKEGTPQPEAAMLTPAKVTPGQCNKYNGRSPPLLVILQQRVDCMSFVHGNPQWNLHFVKADIFVIFFC